MRLRLEVIQKFYYLRLYQISRKISLYQLIKYFLIYLNKKMKSMTTLNFMKSKIHLMEKQYVHLIDPHGY